MCACRFWTKFLLTKTKSACWNFFHKFSFWILNWNPKKQNWYLSVTDLFLPIGILIWLKKSSGKCHKKWWWWYMSIIMIMKNSTKFNSSKSDWLIHYPTILLDWKEKYDFPFLIMIIIIIKAFTREKNSRIKNEKCFFMVMIVFEEFKESWFFFCAKVLCIVCQNYHHHRTRPNDWTKRIEIKTKKNW